MEIYVPPSFASHCSVASNGSYVVALRNPSTPSHHTLLSLVASPNTRHLLPGSLHIIGCYARCGRNEEPQAAAAKLHQSYPSVEFFVIMAPLPNTTLHLFQWKNQEMRQVAPTETPPPSSLFLARCSFERTVVVPNDIEESLQFLNAFIDRSIAQLPNGITLLPTMQMPLSQAVLSSSNTTFSSSSSSSSSSPPPSSPLITRGRSLLPDVPVVVRLLVPSSGPLPPPPMGGVLHLQPASHLSVHQLLADVLLYADAAAPVAVFLDALRTAVIAQLTEMRSILGGDHCRAFHFRVVRFPHPITVLFPVGKLLAPDADALLVQRRREHHQLLGLPLDRPLLRLQQALYVHGDDDETSEERHHLRNVHKLIGPLAVGLEYETAQAVCVEGDYDYYHYMQDSFDDKGWGCAYRSLQTRYVRRKVPTHREIQQALVDINDKPRSIIGSSQWIGAVEVAYALDHLLNVTSRIVRINSGEEVVSKAAELAAHFENEGTPVMIGGGVLAFTMLGVARSDRDVRFLILDPHYTGNPSNPKIIRDKGWCAWKRWEEIFKAGTFYNLCLPRRPRDL